MSNPQQTFVELLASVPAEKLDEFRAFVLSKLDSVEKSTTISSSAHPASESSSSDAPKAKKAIAKKIAKPKMTPDIAKREQILDDIIGTLQQMLPVTALSPDEEKQLIPPNHPDVMESRYQDFTFISE